ncbi:MULTISPECIES: sporulation integral membrane protein YtvI [Brevibacillus]|jgi:sporulation integral membrane protein YtvI|uniref:Sporulation integral membrane protein YtvI n=1 Tax=Brevibacillus parabrevis TaxID=54914 RepID=A0A4Y3PK25_BREPA|nr:MULTISPECIES: sporulation integral membrane protein YtvI [Brevibacillus]MDH6348456.1 sporulation integral membrane protein YtvI [Brevibacillus sp. 1238]MDR5002395.1 sporulation integral membrane protein YtvI [Brevibacillus parabrevis]MED1721925.1 sporulation integral membrane protein YtvI [Brevibacillus parabrevis]MED2256452.1 sporulation integral membrane protein YtvI [Brevibacillus parabrevis]NRQ52967.1 sporulation integral membrane protein YtvI [Brevibacillus sp. HD1.4A]
MTIRKMLLLGLLLAVALFLLPYSVPFLLALLTAILLEPLVLFLIRRVKMNRMGAVSVSFLLFLVSFGIILYWIATQIVIQGIDLAQRLPGFSQHLFELVESYLLSWESYYATLPADTVVQIQSVFAGLKNWAITSASGVARAILGAVAIIPGFLISTIIYLVALFLISLDLPRLRAGFLRMFTVSAREKVNVVFSQLNRATVGFLRAQIILSLLTFLLSFLGLLILHVKYAAVVALLIVLVDILPILGTGSFLVPWAVYNFLTGNARLGIGLIILFLVITVVRRIIEPKVLASNLGISALAALVSLFLGFQVMGFFGLIIGPALVIIYEALRKAGFLNFKIDF